MMLKQPASQQQLVAENETLRARLAAAETSLREMRSGEVDALVVQDAGGAQLFAPANADQSFRILVGEMSDGALTMTAAGLIVYANRHFAGMVKTPLEKVIGSTIRRWIAPASQPVLQALLEKDAGEERHGDVLLAASDGTGLSVHLSVSNLPIEGRPDAYCLVAFDLTEHNRTEAIAASERVARELLAAANQSRAELLRVIEEKTQAEKALAQENQRNRALLRRASDGVHVIDADGKVLEVSDTFCQMLDYSRQELMGANVSLWDAQWSEQELKDLVASLIQKKGLSVLETRHRRRDGSVFDVEINVQTLELDGKPALFNSSRNITERNRARQALQIAGQQQRQLAEKLEVEQSRLLAAQRIARIGNWETTLPALSVQWSDETHRIHETDPATFHPTHQSFLDYVHPDDRARVDAAFSSSIAGGQASVIEHRLLMPDKRIKFVEEHWQIIADTQGVPIRAVGTCQDITERKLMQMALQESETEFRILAEAMPQMVWVTRADGWNLYFNQHWMDYTGLTLGESLGHGWNKPFHPDDRQPAWDAWQLATQTAGTYSIECRLRRADGTYRWWLVRGVPLKDAAGAILKWFGTCTDINDMKMAELEIARYVEQLQTAVMGTVRVATTLSEMRDPYTAGHARRVAEIAMAIGAGLGFDARRQQGLRIAGHLHDVGKIIVPTEILSKPGRLNVIEFKLIQGHAQAGYDVLKDIEFPWPVAQVALQHHERINGSGYPQGLKGDAILFEARIMAVADVVEAMSSHRPYRPGLGIAAALAEIERGRGTLYDAVVADACLQLFRQQAFVIPA